MPGVVYRVSAVARVSVGLVSTGSGGHCCSAEESEETMGKRKNMPVDMRRVIRAAVDAALEDPVPQPQRKRRLLGGRGLLLGAGLMTAGKLAVSSRGREVFGTIMDRMEDVQDKFLGPDDELVEDAGALDEQEEVDAEEEQEPQGEAMDDELDVGEKLGDSSEDDELDEDEPEPEHEEDAQPRRTARTRRPRAERGSPVSRDRKRSRGGGSRRQAVG